MIEVRCGRCNKLLFKCRNSARGTIYSKCPRCRFLNEIVLGGRRGGVAVRAVRETHGELV